ncbi:hypothetical protein AB0L40_00095 [Patulibacter sp. NPDC049589]|uniref:hypothetical protein n=1 Tax=Patulibacter sp. NPDC049589 TaxID=3154731 RepID=UPI00343D0C21
MRRPRILLAASGVSVAAVAGLVAVLPGPAVGAAPAAPHVAVLSAGPAASLPPAAVRVLGGPSLADRGADPQSAKQIASPGSPTDRWFVVPSRDGACLVTPDATVACASTANVDAGTLRVIDVQPPAPGAGDEPGGSPLDGPGVVRGVVPDGVDAVRVVDADGGTVATAPVRSNVYRLEVDDVAAIDATELVHDDGSATAIRPGG